MLLDLNAASHPMLEQEENGVDRLPDIDGLDLPFIEPGERPEIQNQLFHAVETVSHLPQASPYFPQFVNRSPREVPLHFRLKAVQAVLNDEQVIHNKCQ